MSSRRVRAGAGAFFRAVPSFCRGGASLTRGIVSTWTREGLLVDLESCASVSDQACSRVVVVAVWACVCDVMRYVCDKRQGGIVCESLQAEAAPGCES